MTIPKDIVEKFLPTAEKIILFDKPIMFLTKKEMAVTIAYLLREVEHTRDQFTRVAVYQSSTRYRKEV